MNTKKIFIYFLILLITAYPVSAGDVSLNRWVLNVTLHDDGLVEETIQAEIENSGSVPLGGFSFVVPASKVTISNEDIVSIPSTGQDVTQQIVQGGVKISVNFNTPVEAGKKWNGRISFKVENWAVKNGQNYSIGIPVKAPQVIIAGNNIDIAVPDEAEIRSQVFLPKSVEVISVLQTPQQKPYKKLLQNNLIVITWFTGNLHVGDVIKIEGSYSDSLNKIILTGERMNTISVRIAEAKKKGMDVLESEAHIKNASDYLNQAEISFWKKENTVVLEYTGYANDELKLAENSLAAPAKTETNTGESKQTPLPGADGLILMLLVSFVIIRRKQGH